MPDPRTDDPAQSVNELLQDAAIRHRLGLDRLSGSIRNDVISILNDADDEIESRLQSRLRRGLSEDAVRPRQLNRLRNEIQTITSQSMSDVKDEWRERLKEVAKSEGELQVGKLKKTIPVDVGTSLPTANTLEAVVTAEPFQGNTLSGWADKVTNDRTNKIMNEVRKGIASGDSNQEIVDRVMGTRQFDFKDGVLDTSRNNVAAITRTAVTDVSERAREVTFQRNSRVIKGVQYIATLDNRTTIICASLNNNVYQIGKGPRPPQHFNCIVPDSEITHSPGIKSASKRRFDGDVFVIETASGREITCTPNHPVLTREGWVTADGIDVGNEVVCHRRGEGEVFFESISGGGAKVNSDTIDVPTTVHDIAESFFESGDVVTVPMPVSGEDFHGDGTDSEIGIIGTNRLLMDKTNSPLLQKLHKLKLMFGNEMVRSVLLPRLRNLYSFIRRSVSPSGGVMGGFGEFVNFILGSSVHSRLLLAGSIPEFNPTFFQDTDNRSCGTVQSEFAGDSFNSNSVFVSLYNFINSFIRERNSSGLFSDSNVSFFESSTDSILGDSEFIGNVNNGSSTGVFFDNVVNVKVKSFRGHVYNLQTKDEMYGVDGIITHNCRSVTTPVTKSWREMGIDRDEIGPSTRASMDGQVPAGKSFEDFMRDPNSSIDPEQILGKTRARLWREGNLDLNDFLRGGVQNKNVMNLDELRQRHGEAFEAIQ